MANIRGEGGATQREMLATIKLPENSGIKDGVHKMNSKAAKEQILGSNKNVLMNIQMNNIGKSPEEADPNPHLYTQTVTKGDGNKGYNHGFWYSNKAKEDGSKTQVQQMLEHCDKFSVENGYATFAIKGDVGVVTKNGVKCTIVKTNTMQPSSQEVTPTLNADQFNATVEAAKYAKAQREAQNAQSGAVKEAIAEAENAGVQAEGAEMDEPQA